MSTATITVIERAKVEQINRAHRAVEAAYGNALSYAIDCGRMLSAVKADLNHGEWLPWLEDNFEGNARTAQIYMQLADAPELPSNANDVSHLSLTAALKQVQKPQAPRKATPNQVAGFLQQLGSSGDSSSERLDEARERLRAEATEWTEQQKHKRDRVLQMLDDARRRVAGVTESLAPLGAAEEFRQAAVEARHVVTALNDLAFTFER